MKKVKFFGLAGFILLASGAGFSSCSSDSADPTGGTGVAGQVVKTQFAINIPYGNNPSANQAKKVTRMTADMTQQNNHFRGISGIVLLTFDGDPATKATSIINIGTDGNAYSQDTYRRLYRDIEIPVGTSNMIFYGRATKKSGDSEFKTGKITDKGDKKTEKTLAKISHELTAINSEADFATDVNAKAIINALNGIAQVKVTDDDNVEYTWATIGNKTDLPTWLTAHEKDFLKTRYEEFISLKAGSKTSVVAFINNLKAALKGETADANIPDEKKLTKAIYNQCETALTSIKNIDFPGNFNLPDGVAALTWTSEGKFAYNAPGTDLFSTGNTINYKKICYPAELSYFVNTTTMVSNKDMSNLSEFPTYENWTKPTGANWDGSGFTNTAVENSTRTVGLKDPVQYSVAVLKSTVRCNTGTLEDNAHAAGDFNENQQISVPKNGFKVTGILIGGQPASVDWKYEPASETFEYTIYDNDMNGSTLYAKNESTTPTTGNYTLVFDNKSTDKKPVFVTIELENNSDMDFYGQDGIILKGTKFYLVGKLDATENTEFDRVFVQDHITTANFTIKDLKKAYNCIPDLRTSGINVGLAVDLSWQEGITFDVNL